MDLYTLDSSFLKSRVIDDFSSAIWTERYFRAGDFELHVPPNTKMLNLLREGTFIGLNGTREVMILETRLIEEGKLKVTGSSLTKFLANRAFHFSASMQARTWDIRGPPGNVMAELVDRACLQTSSNWWERDENIIRNLDIITDLGFPDDYSSTHAIPYGPVYDALEQLGTTYGVGFTMYLYSADASGYELMFRVYKGRDRTSRQTLLRTVRFSPSLDSLTDVRELQSIANYKNGAVVYAPNVSREFTDNFVLDPLVIFVDAAAQAARNFDKRMLTVFADDIREDDFGGMADGRNAALKMYSAMNRRGQDALANNNFVRAVDGEIVPQSKYRYGTDYFLGDIIELQAMSGTLSSARVTEYIRTQDATGERAYPTISVIE